MENWFYHPHSSGLSIFLMGGWTFFAVYHILLYAKNRNSLYILYGLYLICIMGYQVTFLDNYYPFLKNKPFKFIASIPEFFAETSYLLYFVFALKFLRSSEEFPKWYYHIKRALILLSVYCLVTVIINIVFYRWTYATMAYHFFVIYILVLSVITYIMFFRSRHPLRFYIIIGSICLTFFSVLSLIFVLVYYNVNNYPEWVSSYLYLGYILETALFALGLGHYQYNIYQERNQSQNKLIQQLKENESLRFKIQQKLEFDVAQLSQQAEKDKIENIKIRYQKELAELKVSALRSQMNPHFIFNSLNSIKRYIIDNEQENAVYYLNKFSKLIRKILSSSVEVNTILSEELDIAKLYVNIENIRLDNSIEFKVIVDQKIGIETFKVPSLILQPFLENAIWHGLSLKKGERKLSLEIKKLENDNVLISIIDNGIGRQRAQKIKDKKIHKRQSFGIAITKERLQNFSYNLKSPGSIEFIDLLDANKQSLGTRVDILIPYE
ncbi:7TM diverse intracellular signalling [Flavobacteriaceae bacterium MAR_2010_188]|nr:7TM diverse intracellular signalling [Flavobacteriaceae bacterium MAR_2010_188]